MKGWGGKRGEFIDLNGFWNKRASQVISFDQKSLLQCLWMPTTKGRWRLYKKVLPMVNLAQMVRRVCQLELNRHVSEPTLVIFVSLTRNNLTLRQLLDVPTDWGNRLLGFLGTPKTTFRTTLMVAFTFPFFIRRLAYNVPPSLFLCLPSPLHHIRQKRWRERFSFLPLRDLWFKGSNYPCPVIHLLRTWCQELLLQVCSDTI